MSIAMSLVGAEEKVIFLSLSVAARKHDEDACFLRLKLRMLSICDSNGAICSVVEMVSVSLSLNRELPSMA